LEIVSWLVEQVLGAIVWDSSSGPHGFNHLLGFSVLNRLSFVFVVVGWEWGTNNGI
jgi:hypothetical protein